MKTHSVWIIPTGSVYAQTAQVIARLAKEHNGPVFSPHMTILGPIDRDLETIKSAIHRAIDGIYAFTLTLGPVSFSTTYFQSVFVRVVSVADLMEINVRMKKFLNMENSVYMPHISLFYGDTDMKTLETIVQTVTLPALSWIASEIVIIPEQPDPAKWAPVATISLPKSMV